MRRRACLLLALCCPAGAWAETRIDVGKHRLLPNMPNQVIKIRVRGDGDLIQGVNLNAQIGASIKDAKGVPVFQAKAGKHFKYPGPRLCTLLAPGSILEPPATEGENAMITAPTLWQSSASYDAGPAVSADGLLVTLCIDTTGIYAGEWPLSLGRTEAGSTDWAGSQLPDGTPVPDPVIVDGTITVSPSLEE